MRSGLKALAVALLRLQGFLDLYFQNRSDGNLMPAPMQPSL